VTIKNGRLMIYFTSTGLTGMENNQNAQH